MNYVCLWLIFELSFSSFSPKYKQSVDESISNLTIRNENTLDNLMTGTTSTMYLQLLYLMTSEGFWRLSEQLAIVLSVSTQGLNDTCPFKATIGKEDNDCTFKSIWATALALTWLRSNCEGYKEEWQLVESKVECWLTKQSLPTGIDVTDLNIIAENALKTLKGWPTPPTNTSFWSKARK